MISARLWKRKIRAAIPATVGGTIVVNDVPLTIVGILPDGFAGLSGKAELWIPPPMAARLYYAEYLTTPQNFISVVARLKDGVTLQQANAELAAIGPRFIGNGSGAPDTVWGATAVPLREARVDPMVRQSALVLLAAAACVLADCLRQRRQPAARPRARRGAARSPCGWRSASGRRRLVQQLLTEGLVMAAIAGGLRHAARLVGRRTSSRGRAPAVIASGRNNYAACRHARRAGARSRRAAVRARRRARHDAAVRARAGARGVARRSW